VPESDGGSPITGYLVEKRDSKRETFTKANTTKADVLSLKITKLVEGNQYYIRVFAINEIDSSEPVTTPEPITAKLPFDPPNPPIHLRADDVTKSSATLKWEPPEFDGGSPITGYYIEKYSGKRWVKVNKKPIKNCELAVDELIEKTEYEFRALAENAVGVSKPSETIRFVAKDPFDVPGQPGQPVVDEIKAATAKLSWKAPTSDGGSPITNYIVEMKKKGDVKWSRVNIKETVTDTVFTVPGLKEDAEYQFRITAENKAGPGSPSKPSELIRYGQYSYSLYSGIRFCALSRAILKFLLLCTH